MLILSNCACNFGFLVWYNALDCLRLSAQEDHDVVVCYIHAFVYWNAGLVVLGLGFVNGMPFPEATCSILYLADCSRLARNTRILTVLDT